MGGIAGLGHRHDVDPVERGSPNAVAHLQVREIDSLIAGADTYRVERFVGEILFGNIRSSFSCEIQNAFIQHFQRIVQVVVVRRHRIGLGQHPDILILKNRGIVTVAGQFFVKCGLFFCEIRPVFPGIAVRSSSQGHFAVGDLTAASAATAGERQFCDGLDLRFPAVGAGVGHFSFFVDGRFFVHRARVPGVGLRSRCVITIVAFLPVAGSIVRDG